MANDNDLLTFKQGKMIAQRSKEEIDKKVVTVEKLGEATQGFASSYIVKQNGLQVGATIDIPKDFLVRSAEAYTVTEPDVPVEGYTVGQKYIDFVVNTADDEDEPTHIYLLTSDLVSVYTAGNGISISLDNVISARVAVSGANGLSATENGLKLALATANVTTVEYVQATGTYVEGTIYYTDYTGTEIVDTSDFVEGETDVSSYYVEQTTTTAGTAGALSAGDKTKLDRLQENVPVVSVPSTPIGMIYLDNVPKTVVEFATDAEILALISSIFDNPEPEEPSEEEPSEEEPSEEEPSETPSETPSEP